MQTIEFLKQQITVEKQKRNPDIKKLRELIQKIQTLEDKSGLSRVVYVNGSAGRFLAKWNSGGEKINNQNA